MRGTSEMAATRGGPVVMAALVAALLGAALGCGGDAEPAAEAWAPLVAFDTAVAVLETDSDTVRISVELAETEEQRGYGLMERPALGAEHGMIFVYTEPQSAESGFWMYRTRVPLDIAFLDETGRIVAIRQMQPCDSPNPRLCRTYAPGVPYLRALEVNQGFLAARGVEVGDRVRLVRDGDGAP